MATVLLQLENALLGLNNLIEDTTRFMLSLVVKVKARRQIAKEKIYRREERIVQILNMEVLGEELFTVPNMFSLSRVVLAFLAWPIIAYGLPSWIIISILVAAIITDRLDGVWARLEGETNIGAALDPWCDKIFFIVCVMPSHYSSLLEPIVLWMLISIEAMLFLVPLLALIWIRKQRLGSDADIRSNICGKVKLFFELATLFSLAIRRVLLANYFLLLSAIFALLSIIIKLKRAKII